MPNNTLLNNFIYSKLVDYCIKCEKIILHVVPNPIDLTVNFKDSLYS